MKYILYNPKAGNGSCQAEADKLKARYSGEEVKFIDITGIEDFKTFFMVPDESDEIIICGGDGTVNRFVNDIDGIDCRAKLYYYAAGSGNDFLHDIGGMKGGDPVELGKYVKGLPVVTVKGKQYRFINGVGYGIDGYCCEVGDQLRETTDKPINYAGIAIKGLLFHYKPTNAEIIVDGTRHVFSKVWLAPTMFGRFYGGGMMPTPDQDRLSDKHTVSTLVMFGSGKIKTLAVFPSIFKGEHVKHTEMVQVLTGHDITVKFDRPTAVQIDGETILGVTEYNVKA